MTNPIRQSVNDFCKAEGICTSCYGRMALATHSQCGKCLERKRRHKAIHHESLTAYHKEYYKKHREVRKDLQRRIRERNKHDTEIH